MQDCTIRKIPNEEKDVTGGMFMKSAIELWQEAWKECLGDKDLTNARVGGRASKDKPNKEDVIQWQKQGVVWVEEYIQWRKGNPNWKIWKTPQGIPAIELGLPYHSRHNGQDCH